MNNTIDPVTGYPGSLADSNDTGRSAVSWAAIAAGAVVAASTSLLLVALGGGLGLASLSPWTHTGASVGTFTAITAIGLIVVQWVSAGVGGYIAGRLRTKWINVHTHEVLFRDTAHGFVTWATATLLASAAAAVISSSTAGAGLHAVSTLGASAAMGATAAASSATSVDPYDVDTLLRSSNPSTASSGNDARPQITRILAKGLTTDDVPGEDRAYLAQLVSSQTGTSLADAQARVDSAVTKIQAAKLQAKQAADKARKAAEVASILTALAMLIGAFIASVSAALGGKLRDLHP
jgi:hypothetical protein